MGKVFYKLITAIDYQNSSKATLSYMLQSGYSKESESSSYYAGGTLSNASLLPLVYNEVTYKYMPYLYYSVLTYNSSRGLLIPRIITANDITISTPRGLGWSFSSDPTIGKYYSVLSFSGLMAGYYAYYGMITTEEEQTFSLGIYSIAKINSISIKGRWKKRYNVMQKSELVAVMDDEIDIGYLFTTDTRYRPSTYGLNDYYSLGLAYAIQVNFSYNGIDGYKYILDRPYNSTSDINSGDICIAKNYPVYDDFLSSGIFTFSYGNVVKNLDKIDGFFIDTSEGATIDGDGIFDFGEVEQEVPETFYNWLTANFQQVGDYTFTIYTATGDVIQTFEDALSITGMTLSTVANAQTLTITFSDGSTSTVEWISDVPEGYYFAGLSRTAGGSIFLQPNGESTTEISSSSDFYEVFLKYGDLPDVEFEIDLMQNSAEHNRVDKSDYLTTVATLSGALRHTCSIQNPVILIDYTTTDAQIPEFNYVYIAKFNRYYYVQDLTSIRTGLWQMSLQCDVLMSFKDTILTQNAFVLRSSMNYNDYLQDTAQPMTVQKDVQKLLAINALGNINHPKVDLTQVKTAGNTYCYIISVLTKSALNTIDSAAVSKSDLQYQAHAYTTTSNTVKYLCDKTYLDAFVKSLVDPDFWTMIKEYFTNYDDSAVISIMAYPRDLYDIFNGYYKMWNKNNSLSLAGNLVVFNTTMTDTNGYKLTDNCLNQKWYVGSLVFDKKYNNFLDYGAYTTIQVYLPCIGTIDLSTDTVIGKTVDIYYIIDWETGACTAELNMTTGGTIVNLGMYKGHYGTEIAVVSSDMARITMNGIMQTISMQATGTVDAITQAVTGNPVGAVTSAVKSSLSSIQSTLGIFTTPAGVRAYQSGAGIENAYMTPNPYAIITRAVPLEVENYKEVLGKPSGVYTTLDNFRGYTVVGMVHLQGFGTATRGEVDEIENALRNGVMLADSENTNYLDPSSISFAGYAGDEESEETDVRLLTADGDAVNILDVVLNSTELTTNIYFDIVDNRIAFYCTYSSVADGTYLATVYDIYQNAYELYITIDVREPVVLETNSISYSYGESELMNIPEYGGAERTINYSGEIAYAESYDYHIYCEFDNDTHILTIKYGYIFNTEEGNRVTGVLITDSNGNYQILWVYLILEISLTPESVEFNYDEGGTATVTVRRNTDLNSNEMAEIADRITDSSFGIYKDPTDPIDWTGLHVDLYTLTSEISDGENVTITSTDLDEDEGYGIINIDTEVVELVTGGSVRLSLDYYGIALTQSSGKISIVTSDSVFRQGMIFVTTNYIDTINITYSANSVDPGTYNITVIDNESGISYILPVTIAE